MPRFIGKVDLSTLCRKRNDSGGEVALESESFGIAVVAFPATKLEGRLQFTIYQTAGASRRGIAKRLMTLTCNERTGEVISKEIES